MKESKAMMKKEVDFMKKKGAPKSMIAHEKAEYGMKKGGMAESKLMKKEGRGMAKADMQKVASKAVKGHEARMHGSKKMMGGGMAYKKGGAIDGCATKGKTKGTMVKMGAAKPLGMKRGGKC